MAERLRAPFLNHSIISPLCLVWVRAPLRPHVRQAKFCLRVCKVVFLEVLPFSPLLLMARLKLINLERDVKLKNCALPLYMYQLKSMSHDHDLEVTNAGLEGTALNFTQTSANMRRINLTVLIHIHIQKTGELKRKACTIK